MSRTKIRELKRLLNQPELISPIEYFNPRRDKDIFYEFVRAYAERVGSKLEDKGGSFLRTYMHSLGMFAYCLNPLNGYENRFSTLFCHGVRLTAGALLYPFFGYLAEIEGEDDFSRTTIWTSSYPGLWGLIHTPKLHEYMHGYNAILIKDLRNRKLIPEEAYSLPEPKQMMRRAPTNKELKQFERKILSNLIDML